MIDPVPAPIFFTISREAVTSMRLFGMTEIAIASAVICIRAAAIAEERHRVDLVASSNPPQAGIRAQDILREIRECDRGGAT